jgi:hypothetical protein
MNEKRSETSFKEEEKTSEVWEDEEKERHERASAELLREDEKGTTVVNPSTSGGKILEGPKGKAAGAKNGYPSPK